MRHHRIARIFKFVLFAALAVAAFSFVVLSLWNWLLPALFGFSRITYWQAVGVLVLSKILFGGLRGRGGPAMFWRRRMMERWAQMTPEDREKFRAGLRERCGPFAPPETPQKA
jgi:hypothetical protein